MQVIALSCPNCGSALAHERARCDYCGTVTTISSDKTHAVSVGIACPKCNATNNEKEKHCGQCAAVLLIECPKPRCLEPNSVWRKHCKKCGTDIRETWRSQIEERTVEIQQKLSKNRSDLKQIATDLESAEGREKVTKIIIGGVGVVISLLIFSSAGANGIIGVLIVMAIALIWAVNHKSEEKNLLQESKLHAMNEIEELEAELKTVDARLNELDEAKT